MAGGESTATSSYRVPSHSRALEESRGEVIKFLEDDMYVPERPQVLEKAFRGIEGLAYFHNEQVIIDSDGKVIDGMEELNVLIEDPAKYCMHLFLDSGVSTTSA